MIAAGLLLSPLAASAQPRPSTTLVLKAPFSRGLSLPSFSTSVYGCTKLTGNGLKWNAKTGFVSGKNGATATPCVGTYLNGRTASSAASNAAGMFLEFPFHVSASGSHSIEFVWNLTLNATLSATHGGCPRTNVTYPPKAGASEYSECAAGSSVEVQFIVGAYDLSNSSWSGTGVGSYTTSTREAWKNSTSCTNFGTPSCSNATRWYNSTFSSQYQAAHTPFLLHGLTQVALWANGTGMNRSDAYVLDASLQISYGAFADYQGVRKAWSATAVSLVDLLRPSNGAALASITIT